MITERDIYNNKIITVEGILFRVTDLHGRGYVLTTLDSRTTYNVPLDEYDVYVTHLRQLKTNYAIWENKEVLVKAINEGMFIIK